MNIKWYVNLKKANRVQHVVGKNTLIPLTRILSYHGYNLKSRRNCYIVVNQRLELLRTLTMTIECIDSLYLLLLFYLLTFVLSVNFAIYLILGIVLHFMYLGICNRTKETHNTTMYFLSKVLKGSSVFLFLTQKP
jgi:hypothetical protein